MLSKNEFLKALAQKTRNKNVIAGAGVDSLKNLLEVKKKISPDWITVKHYNRHASQLSHLLCFGNANENILEISSSLMGPSEGTPLIASVCAADPFVKLKPHLQNLAGLGYAGVQNYPSLGLIQGDFRNNLEETGIKFESEVELMRTAKTLNILGIATVFNPREAALMAEAGADILIAHPGLGNSVRNQSGPGANVFLDEIRNAIRNEDILLLFDLDRAAGTAELSKYHKFLPSAQGFFLSEI